MSAIALESASADLVALPPKRGRRESDFQPAGDMVIRPCARNCFDPDQSPVKSPIEKRKRPTDS